MKQQTGKLGIREYMAILVLMIGAKATENVPASFYDKVQSSAWMIPILTGLIWIIPMFLFLKTMSLFQGKDLFEVIQKLFGKYIGFIVCLTLFFIASASISFDARTYTNIIKTFYFTTTPTVIIYALLMFICAYGAKKGIQHIGSVAYLVVFYAVITLAIALLLTRPDSYIQAIFPIWGTGKLALVKESTLNISLYADFFIAALFIPYMKLNKDFQKGTWLSFIFVIILLSISTFVYLCLFDQSLGSIAYPFHTLIRFISFGSFLGNIEILFLPVWLMGTFIRFSALLYINLLMFSKIFKIKDFEYLIPALATVYLLIGMIPESSIGLLIESKRIIRHVAGPACASISILLWLVALLKGEFKHAKKKDSM